MGSPNVRPLWVAILSLGLARPRLAQIKCARPGDLDEETGSAPAFMKGLCRIYNTK